MGAGQPEHVRTPRKQVRRRLGGPGSHTHHATSPRTTVDHMCVQARHKPALTPTAHADVENMVLATGH
eukprot:341220-Alexandrium_andersonii.AAC.1